MDWAYGPRRTVLDKLLVDAAAEAGAEIREGFSVEEILFEDGRVSGVRGRTPRGQTVTEAARVVIGADGRHSLVARAVRPEQYNEKPLIECIYYTYWSGLPTDGFEVYIRPDRGWAAIPTHDGWTLIVMGWPYAEFETNRKDLDGAYRKTFDLEPSFAERVRGARQEAPIRGTAVPGYFRKPFGPGWALVGDAGYNKDPITAWGISDAFRDASLCAEALHASFLGEQPFDEVMADYQKARDEDSLAMFDVTCDFARLAPPPPEMQQLLGATAASQDAQNQFVSVMAGTMPVHEFFAPENAGRIIAAAQASGR